MNSLACLACLALLTIIRFLSTAKWKILSVGKPVQSSSMYHGNINPERANDGSPSRYWADGTCFDSRRNDMNPWWIVTFGEDAMVRRVTLLNRNGPGYFI